MKKMIFLYNLIFITFFAQITFGQTKTNKGLSQKQTSELKLDLNPYYFLNEETLNGFIKVDVKTEKKFSTQDYYKIQVSGEFSNLENSLGQNYFVNPTGTKYLSKSKPFVFSFGFLEHDYGLSRISSPLDFVDQKSFYDLLNSKRFSDFSLRTSFHLGKTFWRLSYIPFRMDMPFPGDRSFWLPQKLPDNVKEGDETVLFPPKPSYEWQDYLSVNQSDKNNVSLIGEYKATDWQWVWQYYRGLDTDTNIELELNTNTVSANTVRTEYPILLRPIHNLIQRLGFGFVYTTPIKWRIVFENSISLGDKDSSELESEQYVYNSSMSLEWGLPVFGDILMGVIQGFYGKTSANTSGTTVLPPLREALIFGILWKKKTYELTSAFIKSYSLDVSVIQNSVQINFNPNFYIKTSAVFIYGPIPEILSGFVESDIIDGSIGYQTTF